LQSSGRQEDEQADDKADGEECGRGEHQAVMVGRDASPVARQRLIER
jgi:hypothetical protein